MYSNNTKPLLFLPNGESLQKIKVGAKKSAKESGVTLSGQLNAFTKEQFNLPYNKLHSHAAANSPFIENDSTLFLPVNIQAKESNLKHDVTFFISVNRHSITLTGKHYIPTPDECTFKLPQFKDIEMKGANHSGLYSKTDHGWIINAYESNDGYYFISISKNHEGIIVDLYREDSSGHLDSIESVAIEISEAISLSEELPEPLDVYQSAKELSRALEMTQQANHEGIELLVMYDDSVTLFCCSDGTSHIAVGDISVSYETIDEIPEQLNPLSLQIARNHAEFVEKKIRFNAHTHSDDDFCMGTHDCMCSVCLNAMR
ncbi:hypothetical protein VCHA53O466_50369 [Vibrio chagasii]|nr:hypothetical protein VCHA53O466_50369 [Vibrio chagasii]